MNILLLLFAVSSSDMLPPLSLTELFTLSLVAVCCCGMAIFAFLTVRQNRKRRDKSRTK
jgi:hypothetical protein